MKIIKLGLILLIVAAFSGASLSIVYMKTIDKIAYVKNEKVFRLQKEILPNAYSFKDVNDNIKIGYDEANKEVGKIVAVTPKGYAGNIEMLVGVNESGAITEVKIVKQSETPGLGSQAAKPEFLSQFKDKVLENVFLKKQDPQGAIEAITGATISSKAIVNGVRDALEQFRQNSGNNDSNSNDNKEK